MGVIGEPFPQQRERVVDRLRLLRARVPPRLHPKMAQDPLRVPSLQQGAGPRERDQSTAFIRFLHATDATACVIDGTLTARGAPYRGLCAALQKLKFRLRVRLPQVAQLSKAPLYVARCLLSWVVLACRVESRKVVQLGRLAFLEMLEVKNCSYSLERSSM